MRRQGHEESADIVLIMADSYMRQGDWKMIQPEDVTEEDEGGGAAIALGVAERGEATKTGFRQGVRIDRPAIGAILRKHVKAARKGQKTFPSAAEICFGTLAPSVRQAWILPRSSSCPEAPWAFI